MTDKQGSVNTAITAVCSITFLASLQTNKALSIQPLQLSAVLYFLCHYRQTRLCQYSHYSCLQYYISRVTTDKQGSVNTAITAACSIIFHASRRILFLQFRDFILISFFLFLVEASSVEFLFTINAVYKLVELLRET